MDNFLPTACNRVGTAGYILVLVVLNVVINDLEEVVKQSHQVCRYQGQTANTFCGMAVIQRDLDRLEGWTNKNFVKFKKPNAKCSTWGRIISCSNRHWGQTV